MYLTKWTFLLTFVTKLNDGMTMADFLNLPRQMLPFSKKTKQWRKDCLLWANQKTFFNYSLVRKSVIHKKINYDLLNGRLHMSDLELVLNPDGIKGSLHS